MKLIDYGPNETNLKRYLYDQDTGEMFIRSSDIEGLSGPWLEDYHSMRYEFNGEAYIAFSDIARDFPESAKGLQEYKNYLISL